MSFQLKKTAPFGKLRTGKKVYISDSIGNRLSATNNSETTVYGANSLNQYTNISNGTVEEPTYDSDGNLLTDGTWSNAWNGENRAVRIEPMNPSNGSERVDLAYDYMGRRYKEEISVYTDSVWSVVRTNLWLYDGWNPIQEIVFTASSTETNWWTHGLDLSGTLQGAGGIGGFLSWTRSSDGKTFIYSGDANGNITELVDADNPTNIVAAYQWDVYGDPISLSGTESANNVFRWSSKYIIVQTGDYDFGYRILRDHRWTSRDPIGENGGINLYVLLKNQPLSKVDLWGWLDCGPDTVGDSEYTDWLYSHIFQMWTGSNVRDLHIVTETITFYAKCKRTKSTCVLDIDKKGCIIYVIDKEDETQDIQLDTILNTKVPSYPGTPMGADVLVLLKDLSSFQERRKRGKEECAALN